MRNTKSYEDMRECIRLVREHNEGGMAQKGAQPRAHVRTFGCQQNVSDSEKLRGMLAEMGYVFTDSALDADLVLYNTCAVREHAENRIFGNAGALKHAKARNPSMVVALCGCMMQQPHVASKIKDSFAHVDLVFGPHALSDFPRLLWQCLSLRRRVFSVEEKEGRVVEGLPVRRDGGARAWVPVMYGCDNFCTYCVVPYVRGRERSREPGVIEGEVRELVAEGYKEFTLLGQNVNSYGRTLDNPLSFAALLQRLADIPGDFRIRFITSHPKDCTRELIDTIAGSPKICSHIHLPVQSGSDRVLAAMNRGYTAKDYLGLVDYARSAIPGVAFTSDIIVGFPGEEEEDFLKTLELVEAVGYQGLFTFLYSCRTGTKAAEMEDPVPREEKLRWFQRLLDVQEKIGGERYRTMEGSTLRVLVEGPGKEPGSLVGRSESSAIVQFPGPESWVGRFVDVRVSRSLSWALAGEAL